MIDTTVPLQGYSKILKSDNLQHDTGHTSSVNPSSAAPILAVEEVPPPPPGTGVSMKIISEQVSSMQDTRATATDLMKIMFQINEQIRQYAQEERLFNTLSSINKQQAAIKEKMAALTEQLAFDVVTGIVQIGTSVAFLTMSARDTIKATNDKNVLRDRPTVKNQGESDADFLRRQQNWDTRMNTISTDLKTKMDVRTQLGALKDAVIKMAKDIGTYSVEMKKLGAELEQVEAQKIKHLAEELQDLMNEAQRLLQRLYDRFMGDIQIEHNTRSKVMV
ncbi:hypothetical protein SG34_032525 [Thalassomonas viridans]|uniref:Uncharacterized protein n=1 Tax=Thalassomonas viridans TaxID=137584 RepID=A0AAE9Z9U4_9GAMM|nr:hypothetical protein [Thalassomonas viridans]WDE08644.1 hypothetical protein SG34_032525 [Thalassomonas viridans]